MIHPKQHIADLVEILAQKGVSNVIISPGSRNAPLIEAFYRRLGNKCISIVDERSAGYVALGIARNSNLPAVLICTSGTAVVNYGPALAEAYYQQIPIIAITADRPVEWINQLDNQTIQQENIYSNFIRASYNLPQTIVKDEDLWLVHRIVNEAYSISICGLQGPVHLNVPLCEPLYEPIPSALEDIRIISTPQIITNIQLSDELIDEWQSASRILIIHGQDQVNNAITDHFERLLEDPRICVIAENISNIRISQRIESPDLILSTDRDLSKLRPDLLIVSGLQVVSKRLKSFLRKTGKIRTWRIGEEQNIIDTYQQVDLVLRYPAHEIYHKLTKYVQKASTSEYQGEWLNGKTLASDRRKKVLSEIPFSDLKAMEKIMETLTSDSVIELGNSSVIRYSQLFDSRSDLIYFSNRGVSGIDGSLSAAVGTALSCNKLVLAVIGDLSFVYDSNALWNRDLPKNLRIIVINNGGGGIFSLIEGPQRNSSYNSFVKAHHPVNISKLTEAYGLEFYSASDEKEMVSCFERFFETGNVAKVLEIITSPEVSADTFKKILGIK